MIRIIIFVFLAIPIIIFFKNDLLNLLRISKKSSKETKPSVKGYIDILEGKTKPNVFKKNIDTAKEILIKTDNEAAVTKTMKSALAFSLLGFIFGLLLKNIYLSVSLAGGLYFVPLWAVRFKLYAFDKLTHDELEIALGLITTSYIRGNDIVKAVSENIDNIHYPIKDVFTSFLNNVRYVGEGTKNEIEKMERKIDNKLFHQWCDILILCQDDHTLKHTLTPIINKFSDLKAQQAENETNMLLPIRTTVKMIMVVVSIIPILYLFDSTWFYSLWGRLLLSITAIVVFWCINAAIDLSSPIEYDV